VPAKARNPRLGRRPQPAAGFGTLRYPLVTRARTAFRATESTLRAPTRGLLSVRRKRVATPAAAVPASTLARKTSPREITAFDRVERLEPIAAAPGGVLELRDQDTAMVEITTPKLDAAARIIFGPLAKLRRVV
jgi:hypothetical protein